MKYSLIDKLPKQTQREIRVAMTTQSLLGKKTYKDVYIGSGLISLNKDNRLIFREVK